MRRLHRRGDGVLVGETYYAREHARCVAIPGEDAFKKNAGRCCDGRRRGARQGRAGRARRARGRDAGRRARPGRAPRALARPRRLVLPRRLVVSAASFLADPAAEPVGVIGAHGPSFTPPIRHRRDGRAHRGRGRLALVELLNGGALAASLAALAVEEEPQLKPAEHAVAHYGAGALLADPRCAKRACAALAALEAAGVEFRLRHARAARERLDAVAPAAAPSAELVDDDDDDADSVASGPSRVADLGAGSVRSVRTRRTSSPRTVPDVPEDPWPSPRLDPASRRFSAASFLLPNDPRAAA